MTSLNFNDKDNSIDDFFADFLEYRKKRQEKAIPVSSTNGQKKLISINEVKDTVMPKPLELMNNIEDIKLDKYTIKALYNRLSEQLLPYIDTVIKEWDYEGSPIYDAEVTRDSIGTLTDKVIYLAKEDIPEVNKILLSEKFGNWSENEMLRSIVESIIINEIFIEQRNKKNFTPNKNTTNPNEPQVKNNVSSTDYDMEDFI